MRRHRFRVALLVFVLCLVAGCWFARDAEPLSFWRRGRSYPAGCTFGPVGAWVDPCGPILAHVYNLHGKGAFLFPSPWWHWRHPEYGPQPLVIFRVPPKLSTMTPRKERVEIPEGATPTTPPKTIVTQ